MQAQAPAADRDVDGTVATGDACPDRPETSNGDLDDGGCPDAVRAIVGRLALRFTLDRPRLRTRSLAALGRLAEVLLQHPGAAITLTARRGSAGATRSGRELWTGRLAAAVACRRGITRIVAA